eukprot:354619-Prorocentrum_minimum.AAC.1
MKRTCKVRGAGRPVGPTEEVCGLTTHIEGAGGGVGVEEKRVVAARGWASWSSGAGIGELACHHLGTEPTQIGQTQTGTPTAPMSERRGPRKRRRPPPYILSPLPRLVPVKGIFSLPFCEWCPIREYLLSPSVIRV